MIPYKEWRDFHIVTLEGHECCVGHAGWLTVNDWTNVYRDYGIVGQHYVGDWDQWKWNTILRPSASNFRLIDGADIPVNYRFDFKITENSWEVQDCDIANVEVLTMYNLLAGNIWLSDRATGKWMDGIAIEWDNYPVNEGHAFGDILDACVIVIPVLRTEVVGDPTPPPLLIESEVPSTNGAQACDADIAAELFNNGILVKIDSFANGGCFWDAGNKVILNVFPERLKVKYFNPVVNSFSRYRIPTAGGVDLVMNGIGFANDFDEINDLCGVNANAQWGVQLTVSTIKFYTTVGVLAGTITTGAVEFTVDSDTQITIPAATMTALGLAEGTYHVLLSKGALTDCGANEADGYAGDWRTDSYGRMSEGSRFELLVADEEDEDEDEPPNPRTRWIWGEHDGEVLAYYSYLDTRGKDTFWEGRIKNMSPVTRSIDDRTGLFAVSDTSVTLANNDMEMSKMLSRYFLKNKFVDFFYGWGRDAEARDKHYFQGVVIDHDLIGTHFDVMIRDVTQKYFGMDTAQYICTLEEYPNIHESAVGKAMPDALGLCSLIPVVAGENSGAIEARYIDTSGAPFSYLAARFSLFGITEVYSNNVAKTQPADYTIAYRDGGRTYIDFVVDQGDNKITFNCKGYSVGMWDDPANGYIQNPAYIISFFLTQIVGMPLALLDMESFDDYAALCTTNGWHQEAKLILQDGRDAMEVLKELLYSFGANLWIARDGRLTIGRKDISNFETDLIVFEQIHAFEHAKKEYGLQDFVNAANVQWDYIPTYNTFKKAEEINSPLSIENYGKKQYPSTPWHFPWITSDISADGDALGLAAHRMSEELMKHAFGYKKIHIKVPIQMIDDLDIFTNFRYQDPFGLSWTKEGEKGRYYYISSLTYDFQSRSIDIVGIDLQYLLGQYLIIGDCDALPNDWTLGSEHDRIYAAVSDCTTGRFSNGDPGKRVGPC